MCSDLFSITDYSIDYPENISYHHIYIDIVIYNHIFHDRRFYPYLRWEWSPVQWKKRKNSCHMWQKKKKESFKSFTYDISTKYKPLAPSILKYHNWYWPWKVCTSWTLDAANWGMLLTGRGAESEAKSRCGGGQRGKDSDKPAARQRGGTRGKHSISFVQVLSHCLCVLFVGGLLFPIGVFCYCCLFQHLCFKELNTPPLFS